MKMLLNVIFPTERFNELLREGSAGRKLNEILSDLKPEAVYFTGQECQRSVILILDLADPSGVPAAAEPWFLVFNAKVEFRVVMSADDLAAAGLDDLCKKWG